MANRKHKIKVRQTEDYNNQPLIAPFNEFIAEKKALGRVGETLDSYKVTFEKFQRDLGEKAEETGNIVGSMFTEWINIMHDQELSAATINHHLAGMRTFMYWCMDDSRKYVENFKIRLIRVQEELPKDYTLDEVNKLLKKPDKKAKLAEWRTWAACNFVIGTAARLGTLVEIRMRDINLKEATVFYQHTKNKKLQVANMSPQLVKVLTEYIDRCRYDAQEDDYLFCSVSGEQISKAAMRQGYVAYAKKRGVNKGNIHGLRHTFAREWYLNGGDVVQLSKILGHSTLAMSEHYMNVYANTAKERFNEFNPLETISRARANARKTIKVKD